MSAQPIKIMVGVASEVSEQAMQFEQYDDRVAFSANYSIVDLTIAHAVLMDLADALAKNIAATSSNFH